MNEESKQAATVVTENALPDPGDHWLTAFRKVLRANPAKKDKKGKKPIQLAVEDALLPIVGFGGVGFFVGGAALPVTTYVGYGAAIGVGVGVVFGVVDYAVRDGSRLIKIGMDYLEWRLTKNHQREETPVEDRSVENAVTPEVAKKEENFGFTEDDKQCVFVSEVEAHLKLQRSEKALPAEEVKERILASYYEGIDDSLRRSDNAVAKIQELKASKTLEGAFDELWNEYATDFTSQDRKLIESAHEVGREILNGAAVSVLQEQGSADFEPREAKSLILSQFCMQYYGMDKADAQYHVLGYKGAELDDIFEELCSRYGDSGVFDFETLRLNPHPKTEMPGIVVEPEGEVVASQGFSAGGVQPHGEEFMVNAEGGMRAPVDVSVSDERIRAQAARTPATTPVGNSFTAVGARLASLG